MNKLSAAIKANDAETVASIIKQYNLKLTDNKITADKPTVESLFGYWDKRQHVRKILLNSAYGALGNKHCTHFDPRVAQSVTLCGRQIVNHMMSKISEITEGTYSRNTDTIIYGDTDSIISTSIIRCDIGDMTVEQLFNQGDIFWTIDDKEYSRSDNIKIAHYSPETTIADYVNYNYVYRHKVSKKKYLIATNDGNEVTVTEDHSVMIQDGNGQLIEKKPIDIHNGDTVITLTYNSQLTVTNSIESYSSNVTTVKSVQCIGEFDNEYVYDIGVNSDDPYFFANDVLVHNSCYFSIWHLIEDAVLSGKMDWTTQTAIDMYDEIADQVNSSFPDFMNQAFNVAPVNGAIIKAGREIVADSTLFIKKKRYAANIVDKEGKRKDKDGKRGEIKAMGLELKRSDTPKYVQEFLLEVLKAVLYGATKQDVAQQIIEFKRQLQSMKSWEKGSPKSVNKLTMYDTKQKNSATKVKMPGHVRAALNWNQLRKLNNDNQTMEITDGMKVTVCKLKYHPLKFTSIAYPVDETRLPTWFTELQFDDSEMEQILVDKKVENLLWVLEWNLSELTNIKNTFISMFDFD